MHTSRARRRAGIAALAIAALLGVGACSGSGSAGAAASSAKAHASAIAANPTVSADTQAAEALLLANYQKEIKATPAHPFKAAQAAIHDTFPSGDTAKIEQFAIGKFTIAMVHDKAARKAWAAQVAAYALAQGGSTASPGTAQIPGTTAVPASPSANST
jgi:ABC-type phosphate/phosphonate transport system substrate-binding protein